MIENGLEKNLKNNFDIKSLKKSNEDALIKIHQVLITQIKVGSQINMIKV